jgi:hypothetical protein
MSTLEKVKLLINISIYKCWDMIAMLSVVNAANLQPAEFQISYESAFDQSSAVFCN